MIVASIGLSIGALTQNLYTMIVTMAMLTTLAMPPMLRTALSGLPLGKEEETRIKRETMDEKGFLPRLERLLLAVDESMGGRTAARLAGLLAGAQGMPVTIPETGPGAGEKRKRVKTPGKKPDKGKRRGCPHRSMTERKTEKDSAQKDISGAQSQEQSAQELRADPVAREVKAGAKKSASIVKADEAEPDPEKVHLTGRVPLDAPAEVVKDESRKGYDVMFIGLNDSVGKDGGSFAPGITRLAAGFDGPLMVLANSGEDTVHLGPRSTLLVPVNGSPQARRAAENRFCPGARHGRPRAYTVCFPGRRALAPARA